MADDDSTVTPIFEELSSEDTAATFQTADDAKPKKGFSLPKFVKNDDDRKAAPTPSVRDAQKLCAELPDMYRMLGMALCAVDQTCGMTVVTNADSLGESWTKLAETSPAFRRFLMRMKNASGWGAVFMAHAPLAIVIAQHHMPEVFGTTSLENEDGTDSAHAA